MAQRYRESCAIRLVILERSLLVTEHRRSLVKLTQTRQTRQEPPTGWMRRKLSWRIESEAEAACLAVTQANRAG